MARSELKVAFAQTRETDPASAARALRAELGDEPGSALVYFASPKVPFADLAAELHEICATPSIGCTTAGELSAHTGHAEDSVVATLVRSPELAIEPTLIEDAGGFDALRAEEEIRPMLRADDRNAAFGLVFIDGLSCAEEQVCSSLANALQDVPFVGGSAGDDQRFAETYVAANGEARRDAAAFALVRTSHPFRLFQAHHFEATNERLVVTGAVPAERRVTELNGETAAEGLARALGVEPSGLTAEVLASHPVMLSLGGSYYIRSVQQINGDGSLTFYCAVAEGLVLRIARGRDLPRVLEQQLEEISAEIDDVGLILGCDCILRRVDMLRRGQRDEVRRIIKRYPMIGFSTYGEQLNGLHMNQTLTGVAIGRAS